MTDRSSRWKGGLLIAALLATAAMAADDLGDSERLVRGEFSTGKPGTRLLATSKAGVSLAEVCFDICDTFQWKGDIKKANSWDFIALFEYKVGFASGSDVYRSNGEKLKAALQRAAQFCSAASNGAFDFDCDWAKYAKAESMRVGIASYDEGQRCAGWRDRASFAQPKTTRCDPITNSPRKK